MNRDELWNIFEKTGSVQSYLSYSMNKETTQTAQTTAHKPYGGIDDRADLEINQLQ